MSPQKTERPHDLDRWSFDEKSGFYFSPDGQDWYVDQRLLGLQALQELHPEIMDQRQSLEPVYTRPPLSEVVLAEFGPMPPEALFLGVASDGLPVLLNLHDPVPGPLLVMGDAGSGKTGFLQHAAVAAGIMHQPEQLQFGVLTSHPEEWSASERIPNNVGIFPLYANSSQDFLLSLASWAHGNHSSKQVVLLLLDGLEAAASLDFDARQTLRWLLLRGPARQVWPVVTANPDRIDGIQPWLDAFHTRIFSRIKDPQQAQRFNAGEAGLDSLDVGSQYAMREGNHWLRFWTPRID